MSTLHINWNTGDYETDDGNTVVTLLETMWLGGSRGWADIHRSGDQDQIAQAHEILAKAQAFK